MRKNPSSCDCTDIRTHVPTSEGFEVYQLNNRGDLYFVYFVYGFILRMEECVCVDVSTARVVFFKFANSTGPDPNGRVRR